MKIFYLVLFFALFIGACADPDLKSICEENGIERACTKREQAMIDSMHEIMLDVYFFDSKKLDEEFLFSGTYDSSVQFYGENHLGIGGQVKTLGAINYWSASKSNPIILLEGADRSKKFGFDDCGTYLIYRIYRNHRYLKELQKRGLSYEGDGAIRLEKKKNLWQIFQNTKRSYHSLDFKLNLEKLKCAYWDDARALNEAVKAKAVSYQNMKRRNLSMVSAIDHELKKGRQVFVSTGFGHMPLGERLEFFIENRDRDLSGILKDEEIFYRSARQERKKPEAQRSFRVHDYTSASRVIYRYLKKQGVAYGEYIHQRMYSGKNILEF